MKLLGSVQPRLFTPPLRPLTPESTLGYDLIEWAKRRLPFELLPHQRWLAVHLLEIWPEDGSLRFQTAVVEMARQQAKTTFANVLAAYRMETDETCRLVVGTSALLDSARETFLKFTELAEDLGGYARPRLANGQENVSHRNGARYKICAATSRGTRGLSVDLLVLDEVREHKDFAAWSAASKTTMARPRGMRLCLSNAGDDSSALLNHLRAVALAGTDPRTAIFEWSAPDGCDLDDRAAWQAANPALGRTVSEDSIASAMATDPAPVFRTEVLCQRVSSMESLFDLDAWDDCGDPAGTLDSVRGRVAAAVDVAPDFGHVCLAVAAALPDGRTRVEIAGAWPSIPEARAALPGLLRRIKPKSLGYAPGPTVGALGVDLRAQRGVKALTAPETAEACAGLVEQVCSRRLLHPGDPLLSAHVAGAQRHPVGEGFRFTRAGGHVDAAYAAALACWLARRSLPAARSTRLVTAAA